MVFWGKEERMVRISCRPSKALEEGGLIRLGEVELESIGVEVKDEDVKVSVRPYESKSRSPTLRGSKQPLREEGEAPGTGGNSALQYKLILVAESSSRKRRLQLLHRLYEVWVYRQQLESLVTKEAGGGTERVRLEETKSLRLEVEVNLSKNGVEAGCSYKTHVLLGPRVPKEERGAQGGMQGVPAGRSIPEILSERRSESISDLIKNIQEITGELREIKERLSSVGESLTTISKMSKIVVETKSMTEKMKKELDEIAIKVGSINVSSLKNALPEQLKQLINAELSSLRREVLTYSHTYYHYYHHCSLLRSLLDAFHSGAYILAGLAKVMTGGASAKKYGGDFLNVLRGVNCSNPGSTLEDLASCLRHKFVIAGFLAGVGYDRPGDVIDAIKGDLDHLAERLSLRVQGTGGRGWRYLEEVLVNLAHQACEVGVRYSHGTTRY